MPFSHDDIIKVCELLSEQEKLKVYVHEFLKGAYYAFGGTLIGGILGGRTGPLVGSALGGTCGAVASKKFSSIITVINEMPEADRTRLAKSVQIAIRNIDTKDVSTLMTILNARSVTKKFVLNIIRSAITQRWYKTAFYKNYLLRMEIDFSYNRF